jgi:hypothetical protein
MDPRTILLPTGRELYLRYHPGETLTLVEVWSGAVDVLDTKEIDLSPIRNVPEGNAPAGLALPQLAAKRAYTSLLVPAEEASSRDLRWMGPGGPLRLTIRVSAATSAVVAGRTGDREDVLRSGAVSAGLDFEARENAAEAWVDAVRLLVPQEGDSSISLVSPDLAVVTGPAAYVAATRRTLREAEGRLASSAVSLRMITVPEPAVRKPLQDGTLRPGSPVARAVLDTLAEAGEARGWRVDLPVLHGVGTGFRTGVCVTGIEDFDVEIAQGSSGLSPRTAARFAGLAGNVRVETTAEGRRLSVSSFYTWADPAATYQELVFRPPVSMGASKEGHQDEPDFRRRAKFPILGGGRSRIDGTVEVAPGAKDEFLLGMTLRGSEAVLLIGSLR